MEVSAGLSKVYKLILKLSQPAPPSHRGDAHRIEFLRKAVLSYQWAHEPLLRVAMHNISFQQLYRELEASLQLNKEAQLEISRESGGRSELVSNNASVAYTGQGRYKSLGNQTSKGGNHKDAVSLSIAGCFNCDEPSHMAKGCPKHRNFAGAAARKLEYLHKKKTANSVHVVLAHLCHQTDASLEHEASDEEDNPSIFESIVDDLGHVAEDKEVDIMTVKIAINTNN